MRQAVTIKAKRRDFEWRRIIAAPSEMGELVEPARAGHRRAACQRGSHGVRSANWLFRLLLSSAEGAHGLSALEPDSPKSANRGRTTGNNHQRDSGLHKFAGFSEFVDFGETRGHRTCEVYIATTVP